MLFIILLVNFQYLLLFMCFMPLNCHVRLKFQKKKVIKEPKMTYFIVFVTDLLLAYFYFFVGVWTFNYIKPTPEKSTCKVIHYGRLRTYYQTID
jgi:hypothetical protein